VIPYTLKKVIVIKSGFSLLEILIALVSVGILSVLAVNRYTSRSEEARISSAKAEEKAIADAERQCEIDTGYFVTLRALDDEPGIGSSIQGGITQYKIESELLGGGYFAIDTDGSFNTGSIFPYANWKGPYINYQNIDTTGSPISLSNYGSPIDPWGHPYRLFTPLILTNPGIINNQTETNYTGLFDRMAIVSYGKDGQPGKATGFGGTYPGDINSDDIVYRF